MCVCRPNVRAVFARLAIKQRKGASGRHVSKKVRVRTLHAQRKLLMVAIVSVTGNRTLVLQSRDYE